VAILMFTGAVGLGYLYGLARRDVLREEVDNSDVDAEVEASTNN